MSLLLAELPYRADSAALFSRIAHRPWAVYLDSGWPGSHYGRYDILAADPYVTVSTRGGQTEIREKQTVQLTGEDPFLALKNILKRFGHETSHLPFSGGAIGGKHRTGTRRQFGQRNVQNAHSP